MFYKITTALVFAHMNGVKVFIFFYICDKYFWTPGGSRKGPMK